MAGIYFHIPFCKTRCYYCDFFSSTETRLKSDLLDAIKIETEQKKDYLENENIETIYFGGGTPSLLGADEINELLVVVDKNFNVADDIEITLEANPDDLSKKYLADLEKSGVNRLSIGIQSFIDKELQLMNRRHNVAQAHFAIKNVIDQGFNNISLDLIYGIPGAGIDSWKYSLEKALAYKVQHLSAYHLTYEKETQFEVWQKSGKIFPVDEEMSLRQYEMLLGYIENNGFQQYEISNFCKPGYISKHNVAYWQNTPYVGIGPSAHSYNIDSRQWNISDIKLYISSLNAGNKFYEKEILSDENKFNEFIMTRLRTINGIDVVEMEKNFGKKRTDFFLKKSDLIDNQYLTKKKRKQVSITKKGRFISDYIIEQLIISN